jgi:hypothetical protein
VEYDPGQDCLVVMSRVFHDDLSLAVESLYGDKISMDSLNDPEHLNSLIRYLKEHVVISMNDNDLDSDEFRFERFEKGNMAIRLFFSIPVNNKKIKTIRMKNTILTKLYADQSNLLIMKIYDKEESFRLTSDNKTVTLSVE